MRMNRTLASRFASGVLLAVGGLIACDESPSDVDVLELRGVARLPTNAVVTARVEQPGRLTTVSHEALAQSMVDGVPVRVRTKTRGTMRVRYLITTSATDTIADLEIPFDLQPGNQYSVSVFRSPANYVNFCFGCTSQTRIPLRGSAQPTTDSLTFYIVNAKPCRGCVY